MHIASLSLIVLASMALPALSAPIVLLRETPEHPCDEYIHQSGIYKTCLTLLAKQEKLLTRGEELLARHGSSGGKPQSLTDLHVAWALHRQTLDDDEVAAVHEAYRGTPAPHASHFPTHQVQSNQHSHQQSQSTPRDLVHGTANEPNIENYMTTHSRASLHGRGRPTMFTNKGARSNPINPSERGRVRHDSSDAYPRKKSVEPDFDTMFLSRRPLHVLGFSNFP